MAEEQMMRRINTHMTHVWNSFIYFVSWSRYSLILFIRNSTIHSADLTYVLPIRQETRIPQKDSVLFQGPPSSFTNSGIL